MIPREILDSYLFTFIGASRLWSISPYRRCEFNCTYCINKTQGDSTPFYPLDETLAIVADALRYVPPDIPLVLGGYTDAYPHVEERLAITRAILELLHHYGRPVSAITKGTFIGRDADIFFAQDRTSVTFSFMSLDDALSRPFEPDTPPNAERVQWHCDPRYMSRRSDDGHPYHDALVEQQGHLDDLLRRGRFYAQPMELVPALKW